MLAIFILLGLLITQIPTVDDWESPRKRASCGHIAADDGECEWGYGCDGGNRSDR